MKNKLSYEWKNIYRNLNSKDLSEKGIAPLSLFIHALRQTNVFLSNEDMQRVRNRFGVEDKGIDYERMSRELGLHMVSFDYMRQTH